MKANSFVAAALMAAQAMSAAAQTPEAHFPMTLSADGKITESVSGKTFAVSSQLPACPAEGIDGDALRFDGYSNFVKADVPVSSFSTDALTFSVVLAAETYPMMRVEDAEQTPSFATICGNLDESAKTGMAFELSSQGDVRFRFGSATGFLMSVTASQKLPLGRWCRLTAVMDKAANKASLFLNGTEIGSARMSRAGVAHSAADFMIGKAVADLKSGPFLINAFCGLIDDIAVYNSTAVPEGAPSTSAPDFNYPASRYDASLWRPRFHAMPSGSWMNESHGMLYADGRYHVFFQKNANGPYMARLHWGHLSSANLYDWREEPIAIAPGEAYDIKGCWSGCVYDDGGTPTALYTAVDNARATIVQATATDEGLSTWQKQGIIINGRPAGLSDDFRDPYVFEANGQRYIIVGTSKNGVGACTLHKFSGGAWTNDGDIFFRGGDRNQHGTFWEMPNVTPLEGGKYLFTCTPLGTGVGVRTLCWVGTIDADGHFQPDATGVQTLELGGISRDGYGLLSPTIYRHADKTLLLGIVPDKLPTQTNYEMGYAHLLSLPREISVDASGQLVQRPYSGLTAMRSQTAYNQQLTLNGTQSLAPVSGRQLELLGTFTVGTGQMGFRFLGAGDQAARLTYDAARGTITLDLTTLARTQNDNGIYNGIYTATLPTKPVAGETLKLNVFVDGSIADIFVADRWAFSVRLFPMNVDAIEAEAFATEPTPATLQAWTLDASQSADGIYDLRAENETANDKSSNGACFDLSGRRIASDTWKGICIVDGKKIIR
ncbi:MAG: GH32 C-terminal domain-containing protein [Bacteroidaceae bacterium]|nr:GH32 C-terminal domain-containing protein [Bacteroidaceae bacterium]